MTSQTTPDLFDRELSWLSFNERVLQEAEDPRVPLYERLRFLAIFSSNLDEFFRVRVASLRTLLRENRSANDGMGSAPRALLQQIHETVTAQQERFGATFRDAIVPALADLGVHLIDASGVSDEQARALEQYFETHVRRHVRPFVLGTSPPPFLNDRRLYLAVELYAAGHADAVSAGAPKIGLVEVPSPPLHRFVSVPSDGADHDVMFLDDVVRRNIPRLFPDFEVGGAFAVKLSRDAELYLDDEFSGSIVDQIRRSLEKRKRGLPCRFLYDLHAPYHVISSLRAAFDLEEEDLVLGGRYHNLHDLADIPRFELEDVTYDPLEPLGHPDLEFAESMFAAISERDHVVHFPYQRFDYVLRFLREAAADPGVESIWATLYRTAPDSAVVRELIRAAERGKRVTAFVEVMARFDEASNLEWAERMEAAGVRTLHSFRALKVHAKLILVGRAEEGATRLYGYLGTGNLNEATSRVYADHGLFTADADICGDARRLFAWLSGEDDAPTFASLLVAPDGLREGWSKLIDREIENACSGRKGRVVAKMNALEDRKMIRKLYDASERGVEIDLIVRGICCLVPGVPGRSDGIRVRSIVDRFLEHARVFVFHNGGSERVYLASADWMSRNLSRRVEVALPIKDPDVRQELTSILDLQLRDSASARVVDSLQKNEYAAGDEDGVRAQADTYGLLRKKWEAALDARQAAAVHMERS